MKTVTKLLGKLFGVTKLGNSKGEFLPVDKTENLFLDEKYPGLDHEELYWLLEDKDRDGEILSENEELFLANESCEQLRRTLHREFKYGRSLAIKELVGGNYQILVNESQNQFKELINFALLHFKGIQKEKPDEVNRLIISHFPIMHLYIQREISGQKETKLQNENLNLQKAYDEFLIFAKNILVSLYPDELLRNEKIRKHFINLHNDMISFIDSKEP